MLKKDTRIIFHIDMNAFFCSVACILDPTLRGKPFAIGREGSLKGVLSTASYEAREYGIHAAMPVVDAYKKLPSLLVIHIDYKYYEEYHNKFVKLISEYTNLIEVASIDEVYADMTLASLNKHPLVLAKEIQLRLLKEYGLSSSIGIAPTLFLAKMASDIKKPLGVTVLRKREVQKILYPLSVKEIFGIGKKTYPKLIDNAIKTIGDFMDLDNKERIISLIGENSYNHAYNCLKGNSTNIVDPNRYSDSSSISTSVTYDVFKSSEAEVIYEARRLTRLVYNRMIEEDYFAKTLILTLRDHNFDTITRRITINDYTDDLFTFYDMAMELVEKYYDTNKRYRLIGIGLSNLLHKDAIPKEYNLFTVYDDTKKQEKINEIMKEYQMKFGKKALFWNKDNDEK